MHKAIERINCVFNIENQYLLTPTVIGTSPQEPKFDEICSDIELIFDRLAV